MFDGMEKHYNSLGELLERLTEEHTMATLEACYTHAIETANHLTDELRESFEEVKREHRRILDAELAKAVRDIQGHGSASL